MESAAVSDPRGDLSGSAPAAEARDEFSESQCNRHEINRVQCACMCHMTPMKIEVRPEHCVIQSCAIQVDNNF